MFDCQNSCCFFVFQNSLLGPSLDFLPLAGLRTTKYPQKVKLMGDSQCHFTTLSSAFKTCFYILFLWRETSVLSKMSVSGKKKKSVKFSAWSFNHSFRLWIKLWIYERNWPCAWGNLSLQSSVTAKSSVALLVPSHCFLFVCFSPKGSTDPQELDHTPSFTCSQGRHNCKVWAHLWILFWIIFLKI